MHNPGFRRRSGETLHNLGFRRRSGEMLHNPGFRRRSGETLHNLGFRRCSGETLHNPVRPRSGASLHNTCFRRRSGETLHNACFRRRSGETLHNQEDILNTSSQSYYRGEREDAETSRLSMAARRPLLYQSHDSDIAFSTCALRGTPSRCHPPRRSERQPHTVNDKDPSSPNMSP